jgi:hypothetical protein
MCLHSRIVTRGSVAVLIMLCYVALQARAADGPAPMLTFDTTSAAPGGKFAVNLWFVGEQVDRVDNVQVSVTGPDWVSMLPNPARSLRGPWPAALTLRVANTIAEGTSTLVFAIRYDVVAEGGKVVTHDAVIEKPVQLGLLSTDSVEGLPLQLVTLVIPGLAGVAILRLRKSKLWDALSGAAEKVGGGLLLSLASLWLLEVAAPYLRLAVLTRPGISRTKLAAAIVAGCLIAGFLLLIEAAVLWLLEKCKRRRELATRLQPGDSFAVAAAKAIVALCGSADAPTANWKTPTVAILPDGRKLIGSTIVRASDEQAVLIGWGNVLKDEALRDLVSQSLEQPAFADRKRSIQQLAARLRELRTLTVESPVRQLEPPLAGGAPNDQGERVPLPSTADLRAATASEKALINADLGAIPLRAPPAKH